MREVLEYVHILFLYSKNHFLGHKVKFPCFLEHY